MPVDIVVEPFRFFEIVDGVENVDDGVSRIGVSNVAGLSATKKKQKKKNWISFQWITSNSNVISFLNMTNLHPNRSNGFFPLYFA